MAKQITILQPRRNHGRPDSTNEYNGTIPDLVDEFRYTLECGASWSHEKGNAKINTNPKSGKTLVKNLNNAVNNSAANGYARESYELIEG